MIRIPQTLRDSLNILHAQCVIQDRELLSVQPITDRYLQVHDGSHNAPLCACVEDHHTHMVIGRWATHLSVIYIYGGYSTEAEATLVLTTLEMLRP